MSSSSSDESVFLCALLTNEEEEQMMNKKRKVWTHNINKKRNEFGEFHHLFPDLLKDNSKFFQYFRMSQEKFYELLNHIKPLIEKQNTRFRRSISSEERLAVCLR